MLDLVFYSIVEVLSGLAPSYTTFLVLRALFGIGMGGEWGVGASLAMEKVPPRLRGVFSGLLQQGYAVGYLLAAVAYYFVFPRWGWRPLFFIGGLPALLALFVRSRVRGIRGLGEDAPHDLGQLGGAILVAQAALPPARALHDGDGLRVARHPGHVSDVPRAALGLRRADAHARHRDLDGRRDHRRRARSASTRTASGRKRAIVLSLLGAMLVVPLWAFAPSRAAARRSARS